MAGAGYKLFNTGDVLTAAQVNTYLQEQTVMVFANSTARTTALSGVLAEGMMSYLQDTNAVEVYNGTSWVNVGNAGDITEVQAGVGISIASGTGPIPVITNSSTDLITTAGDLLYGTAADTVARLGIGTAGQVLKVNSGATAPEWGTASAGALTLIKRASFSNVANTGTTFDGVFSSSYNNYMIKIENFGSATSADDVQLQFRYAGPTTQTTGYYGNNVRYVYNSTTITNSNVNDQAQATLNADSGTTPSNAGAGTFFLDGCSGSSDTPRLTGMYMENITANSSNSFFGCLVARVYTGFLMKSSSTNITGTIAVYGLA